MSIVVVNRRRQRRRQFNSFSFFRLFALCVVLSLFIFKIDGFSAFLLLGFYVCRCGKNMFFRRRFITDSHHFK